MKVTPRATNESTLYVYLSFRWRPEIDILMEQLAVKISHGSQVKKAPIKTTKPQEFSLTKPKPPALPLPEIIPQQEKCKPVSLIYSYHMQYFLQHCSIVNLCVCCRLFLCNSQWIYP